MRIKKTTILQIVLFLLAVLALYIANKLRLDYNGTSEYTCYISACDIVKNSPYSHIAGISIALLGTIYYIGILALLITGILRGAFYNRITSVALLAGLVFTLYLRFLEITKIHAWCELCIAIFIIQIVITVGYEYYNRKFVIQTASDRNC